MLYQDMFKGRINLWCHASRITTYKHLGFTHKAHIIARC